MLSVSHCGKNAFTSITTYLGYLTITGFPLLLYTKVLLHLGTVEIGIDLAEVIAQGFNLTLDAHIVDIVACGGVRSNEVRVTRHESLNALEGGLALLITFGNHFDTSRCACDHAIIGVLGHAGRSCSGVVGHLGIVLVLLLRVSETLLNRIAQKSSIGVSI